jgi:hypothetical protein
MEAMMKLRDLTSETNEDGTRIARVRARILDNPIGAHGAVILTNALERVRQEIDELVREVRLATDKPNFEQ